MKLAELKKLAEAATPGPWSFGQKVRATAVVRAADGDEICCDEQYYPTAPGEDDMKFIAAVNPQAVLKLIGALEDFMAAVSVAEQYNFEDEEERLLAIRDGVVNGDF